MAKCKCITKSRIQCSRNAKVNSLYCWQHQNCNKSIVNTSPKKSRKTAAKKSPATSVRRSPTKKSPTKSPATSVRKSPTKKSPTKSVRMSPTKKSPTISVRKSPQISNRKSLGVLKKPTEMFPLLEEENEFDFNKYQVVKEYFLTQDFDPFDFNKYKDDYNILSKFFNDADLFIRLAIWIDYKYDRLTTEEERIDLDEQLDKSDDKIGFLDNITSLYIPDKMLAYWYLHFSPDKARIDLIDEISKRYSRNYDLLWDRLYKRYVLKTY